MAIRPTQTSVFSLVQRGLAMNFTKLAGAQEQVATGRAILRPSDDAVGTARALSMRRRLGLLDRFQSGVQSGRPILESSTSALEEASGVLSEARSLVIQALNGSMSPSDRQAVGVQMDLILEKLVDVANTRIGDRYIFAGTNTDQKPYTLQTVDGEAVVTYRGNDSTQRISVGFGTELALNVPGSEAFGAKAVQSIDLTGLTGATLGTTASQGRGYAELALRHDATAGALGSGLALAGGGASDTIIGTHTLTLDAAAGTVTLGAGVALPIPAATDPDFTDFVVTNELGGEVHLDFSGYTGVSSTSALVGSGSISLNGGAFTPITLTETDLELIDDSTGTVLHIDTTAVHREGSELVSFAGSTDIFSVLSGVAADLRNADGRTPEDVVARLNLRLPELDRDMDQVVKALGTLGARTERLLSTGSRLETLSLNTEGLLSQVEDVDITTVILEMNQAEQTLQLAQATGTRLIQRTLLDFLR